MKYSLEFFLLSGVALSEMVYMIEDTLNSYEKSPVFILKDLVQMYKDKLKNLGATEDFVKNVHSTRFKESILKRVNGLCEKKKGKTILSTLEENVGFAIYESSKDSSFDEAVILCNTAKIIRKHLFETKEVFNGDLSLNKQEQSVPKILLHLISLILEGTLEFDKVLDNSRKLALNIAQLIRFNSVKTKRRSQDSNIYK